MYRSDISILVSIGYFSCGLTAVDSTLDIPLLCDILIA
jgi:hypothetical protein